ncbi:PREDICTED: modifier of mdg4 isoform X8 [Rhagoletis zephyria]|uniref:modifier of mdg4 isoform X8 n=1 Tax=Rhagoletis zephyria TaxID=28612 RepID=UPI0008112EBC|nr:PREDICTED: modifier of mdg4 isoform X8 [Rhagoletis zephyria]
MADDEQFSLCWNNFNSNLSAGFHESLCRGDLVDVTLAAEGQFVKAHRLVLSVCSPYFRKMFTQMPANQHAFGKFFLKDVSHTALKDLIQFMYCGEVNVKQEALPAFISTAEALQIKGLTDSDPPPSQSPAEPSTPTPQIQQISSPRVRQRTSATRSFKIESVEDSGDDKQTQIVIQTTSAPPAQQVVTQPQTQHLQQTQSQTHIAPQQIASTTTAATTTVVTHKRPARSIGSGPHIKRTKSTIDPLDTSDPSTGAQQITVQTAVVAAPAPEPKAQVQQQQPEPEYIDLPIELPTKSEPDYAEEAGDVEGGENETTYVEDDSYGELRYDESYFTENDEAPTGATTGQSSNVSGGGANATTSKALVKQQQSSFSDNSYVDVADQANSDAQVNKRKLERRVRVVISEDLASQQQQQSRPKAAPVEQLHLLPFTKSLYSEVKTGETILKTSWNNHKLTKISKPRMRGKCVHCLKKASGDQPDLNKITTYCPQCPGGLWMCLECFDQAH